MNAETLTIEGFDDDALKYANTNPKKQTATLMAIITCITANLSCAVRQALNK